MSNNHQKEDDEDSLQGDDCFDNSLSNSLSVAFAKKYSGSATSAVPPDDSFNLQASHYASSSFGWASSTTVSGSGNSGGADAGQSGATQLGFSVPVDADDYGQIAHRSAAWSTWDGGKIGGRPSWLNPRDLPSVGCLRCPACEGKDEKDESDDNTAALEGDEEGTKGPSKKGTPMQFICQLYAPVDPTELLRSPRSDAYHRTLYVFACPAPSCCASRPTGSVRVLRCQLSRKNSFYPFDSADAEDGMWTKHGSEAWDVKICAVCGQRARGRCPVQGEWFCGRECQKEHMKYVHKPKMEKEGEEEKIAVTSVGTKSDAGARASSLLLPSVLPETELVVEEEPPEPTELDREQHRTASKVGASLIPASFNMSDSSLGGDDSDDDDDDANLEQKDLNEMTHGKGMTTGTDDSVSLEFYSRVGRSRWSKEQCLRYGRWPDPADEGPEGGMGPLWIQSKDQPKPEDVPPCQYCGAERKFEFQVMPQMLHYLSKGRSSSSSPLDWGVVAVYTCTDSCGKGEELDTEKYGGGGSEGLGAYRDEFAWRQPPLA